jgi:two-component system OmpR family response regulator
MSDELQRVMLVEDDNDIRTVAVMALEMVGGLKVQACGSGAEALERVGAFAPQLVLLDVMMPGMNGLEVLQALRQRPDTVTVPVVFLTAKAQEAEIAKLRILGALDVIAKPFDPMTLSDAVKRLWQSSRTAG